MSTTTQFKKSEIGPNLSAMSRLRTIVETPFYGNNVVPIANLQEAYDLAVASPGTIVTDLPVEKPEHLGLRPGARVLLFNDGAVTGRAAAARRIVGMEGVDPDDLNRKVMDAVYATRRRKLYHAQVIVGLDEDFMVRAHLLIPEGEENLLYDWMLNFQPFTADYQKRYEASKAYADEGDIYIFSDPQWSHPEHPLGLTYFDPEHNCAALLGMHYFGEHKKGTLTLAWAIANRNGFASCHGGCKVLKKEGKEPYTLAVFGLSGSGKSTITHATHGGRYYIKVLHDDAFIIHTEDRYAVAMEPTYFDKTQDYPVDSPDNRYLLTVQNCGATRCDDKVVIVSEDLRNGNGRAIKSRLWSPNRVDRLDEKIRGICWIMKDPTLPPLLRVNDPTLASLMGATLSTKRTSAERLAKGVDPNALVIEPYANPFRTYPLGDDFTKFKGLFENGVSCYILNTGFFFDKKVPKEITLEAVEQIVDGRGEWQPLPDYPTFSYVTWDDFPLPAHFKEDFQKSLAVRADFLKAQHGYNALPSEAVQAFCKLLR